MWLRLHCYVWISWGATSISFYYYCKDVDVAALLDWDCYGHYCFMFVLLCPHGHVYADRFGLLWGLLNAMTALLDLDCFGATALHFYYYFLLLWTCECGYIATFGFLGSHDNVVLESENGLGSESVVVVVVVVEDDFLGQHSSESESLICAFLCQPKLLSHSGPSNTSSKIYLNFPQI